MSCTGRVALRVTVGCVLVFGGAGVGLGQVVINEFMYDPNPPNDSDAEWFELYNAGNALVDLEDWTVKDNGSNTFTISGSLEIAVGGYLVLGRITTNNGGVTLDYDYPNGFTLANGDDEIILLDASPTPVEQDRVFYDINPWPVGNGAALALKAPDLDNNVADNWCVATTAYGTGALGTPGVANDCPAAPGDFTGPIYDIQSSGAESPHAGAMATTEDNIVTAVGAGGFFIQTPTADSDSDVDTSDGIFVLYDGTATINVGDQVDVTGMVEEFFAFTRIDARTSVTDASVTVDASNQTLPAPVEFGATVPSGDPANPSCAMEYECYEGMRIRIATGTVNSGSQFFRSDPVAEMYITPTASRAFREKGLEYPGDTANTNIPVWDTNPEVFELDPNKLRDQNESWAPGTTFSATGVLGYEFRGYELWPTELTRLSAGPALPRPARQRRAGEISVASLNMLNLNASAQDYNTKLTKLSRYIREVLRLPDVIGVQEVFTIEALMALASRIQAEEASASYTAYLEVGNQATGANVGFLVRSGVTVDAVTQHNKSETFLNPTTNNNDILHDRPPLQLDASVEDIDFSVIVVHNRSLISIETDRVQVKRLEQAQSVARLAQSLQTSKLIIVGDYNAYQFTDGYHDPVGQISGNITPSENQRSGPDLVDPNLKNLIVDVAEAERYSYIFRGNLQALDHALANAEMQTSVVEMVFARGNADAPEGEEENADSALYASDHDGFVVFLSAPGRSAPPPLLGPPDAGGGGGGEPPMADLDLDAESQVVSASTVRYSVNVENAGPDIARNVVVTSAFSGATVSVAATTSGCDEDPDGVPECNLGDIAAGDSASFTIDVDTGGASETSLRYSGSIASDTSDPASRDDEVDVSQPLGPPNAPTDLAATAISSTEIELRWRDNSSVETGFDVFLQGPGDSKLRLIGSVPGNTTSTVVDELVPDIRYNFAVEAYNGPLRSERTPKSTATTWFSDAARCSQDDVLCLGNFEVEVEWNDGKGGLGRGMAEQLTADAGDFWFFHPANIELVVKVLDGCQVNGHYWVFAAGLTDVEVTTTVRDLKSGLEMSWTNPQGTLFEPLGDTSAFATCGEASNASRSESAVRLSGAPKGRAAELYQASLTQADRVGMASSACTASETALCLQNSRYEVQANWQTGERSGAATVIPRTADTGMFWFFSPGNVELIVKVLDGCAMNGHRWVLMGGLTDVGVEIVVTDSESGEAKMYGSPEGSPFATRFDVTAFSCSAGQ